MNERWKVWVQMFSLKPAQTNNFMLVFVFLPCDLWPTCVFWWLYIRLWGVPLVRGPRGHAGVALVPRLSYKGPCRSWWSLVVGVVSSTCVGLREHLQRVGVWICSNILYFIYNNFVCLCHFHQLNLMLKNMFIICSELTPAVYTGSSSAWWVPGRRSRGTPWAELLTNGDRSHDQQQTVKLCLETNNNSSWQTWRESGGRGSLREMRTIRRRWIRTHLDVESKKRQKLFL